MKTGIISILIWALCALSAQANEIHISKKSHYSVEKTLDRLEKALINKGATVFARIDHSAGARSVGKSLPETQLLIFGNPKMGTPLMQEEILVAMDLPMKALAWADQQGQVWLSYLKPEVLAARYKLKNKTLINKMAMTLDALSNQALQAEPQEMTP